MSITIDIKRVYDPLAREDGFRILVDRLWPRGLKKDTADIDEWAKELAPTTELRKWYDHDPERWPDFQKGYKEELRDNEAVALFVKAHGGKKHITLLYAAKTEEYNHAIVLRSYLASRFAKV